MSVFLPVGVGESRGKGKREVIAPPACIAKNATISINVIIPETFRW